MTNVFRFTSFIFCLVVAVTSNAAENWNQYLGPHGNGHSGAKELPVKWSEKENVRWKIPMAGKAWSSPVVWGNQIWLTNAPEDGTKMSVVCVAADTGKIIHERYIFTNEKPDFCHGFNSYASCTPFIEEGRIYVHFGKYGTACLNTSTAETIWQRRDFKCNHWRGPGSSPIVHDGLLFVCYDGYDVQYITALDAKTGATVWNVDRKIDYGADSDNGDRKKAYSTAAVVEVAGKPVLISPSAGATIAYEPKTGQEIWRCNHGGWNASIRPVVLDNLLFVDTHSGGRGTVAIKYDGQGDISDSHIAWSREKSGRRLPNPMVIDGLLYLLDSKGVMTCLDGKTGEEIWVQRVGGNFVASPVYAAGKIYLFNREGKSFVVKPGRTYSAIGENELSAGCMASPAVVGNTLIVRTFEHLYCIGNR
ncbi:MAG: outer membrane protein assembly factor BamB [Pirellulaceae bacterium]|jgi:outer membrane protein assembly factor BamB